MRSQNRREFVKQIGLIAAAVPCAVIFGRVLGSTANAAPAPAKKAGGLPSGAISENDPVAKVVGYKHKAKDVDIKKYPQRAKPEHKKEFCNNCALFTPANPG